MFHLRISSSNPVPHNFEPFDKPVYLRAHPFCLFLPEASYLWYQNEWGSFGNLTTCTPLHAYIRVLADGKSLDVLQLTVWKGKQQRPSRDIAWCVWLLRRLEPYSCILCVLPYYNSSIYFQFVYFISKQFRLSFELNEFHPESILCSYYPL